MAEELVCWRCGESLAKLSLPIGRLDECPSCLNYLHVCRMCQFYDPNVTKACREDDAEEVKEKVQANFCDYFRPTAGAWDRQLSAAEQKARSQLGSLFSDESVGNSADSPDDDPARGDAESLFRKDD